VTGAILIGAGAFAMTGSASVTTKERLLQLGEVEHSADERHTIPHGRAVWRSGSGRS
jgi:hypothetical protein